MVIWYCVWMPALAAAQAPPSEAELVRVPARVIRQCEQDAARVDGLESRLRACQRDLDAGAGALDEARRGELEARVELADAQAQIRKLEAREAARWSPWAWLGIGAGGALLGVVLMALVTQ